MSLNLKYKEIIGILKKGGVGVMPTDTLYGLVGSAFSEKAIKWIYKVKGREKGKKLIVLISKISDLKKFGISDSLIRANEGILQKVWPHAAKAMRGKPEPVSIILNNIAFRLPNKKSLIEILKKTGPLVAPSANPSGLAPAKNIKEAQKYFSDKVDFYLAGGTLKSKPSTLIKIPARQFRGGNKKPEIEVLRGSLTRPLFNDIIQGR